MRIRGAEMKIKNPPAFKLVLNLPVFIMLPLFLIFFEISAAFGGSVAFQPVPLFEIDCASGVAASAKPSPAATGGEIVSMYAASDWPVSFSVFENLNLLLVLDPARERLCRFDMSGKFLGELKVQAGGDLSGFVWLKAARAAFFIFDGASEIGVIEADMASGRIFSPLKKIGVPAPSEGRSADDFTPGGIWPLAARGGFENGLLLNAAFGASPDRAFIYEKGGLAPVKNFPKNLTGAAPFCGRSAVFSVEACDGETIMSAFDIASANSDWVPLLKELAPAGTRAEGVKSVRPAGSDAAGCAYIEALYGGPSGTITACYIYKFNKNGKFMGRVRVPGSPEMPARRYIYIDAAGSIFYMKKSGAPNKVRFYKFMIDELN